MSPSARSPSSGAKRSTPAFAKWLERERARLVHWTTLHPAEAKSNLPLLTVGEDGVVFVSGDMSKSDTYELKFHSDKPGITAIRLEVLPDERLPQHGPGRIFYEGPPGEFMLSNNELLSGGTKQPWARATHSFAKEKFEADKGDRRQPPDGLEHRWRAGPQP